MIDWKARAIAAEKRVAELEDDILRVIGRLEGASRWLQMSLEEEEDNS